MAQEWSPSRLLNGRQIKTICRWLLVHIYQEFPLIVCLLANSSIPESKSCWTRTNKWTIETVTEIPSSSSWKCVVRFMGSFPLQSACWLLWGLKVLSALKIGQRQDNNRRRQWDKWLSVRLRQLLATKEMWYCFMLPSRHYRWIWYALQKRTRNRGVLLGSARWSGKFITFSCGSIADCI